MRDWLAGYIMLNKSKRNNIKHITQSGKSNRISAGVTNPPGPGSREASAPMLGGRGAVPLRDRRDEEKCLWRGSKP